MAHAKDEVLVVGYGTLLRTASAEQTMRGQEQTMRGQAADERMYTPIVVPGFQRLFNLRPDHYSPSSVIGSAAVEAAAMNARPAAGHHLNGVAFVASPEEIARLDDREYCYARIQVPIQSFADRTSLGHAMIYSCPDDWRFTNSNPAELLPLWHDIEWAREGSYAIGENFGRAFDATTFLADGRTLMCDFYAELLSATPPPAATDSEQRTPE